MINRDEIMKFFREDENLIDFSFEDRYELALTLVSHSEYLYDYLERCIERYETNQKGV